jgi:hypothetical protein
MEKPLAQLVTSGQIQLGDRVVVDYNGGDTFDFYVHSNFQEETIV